MQATTKSWQEKDWREIEERQVHLHMIVVEAQVATLEVRDHFAILANEGGNGKEFWILQCI